MVILEIALASLIAGTLTTVAGFGGGLLLLPVLVLATGSKEAVLLSAIIPLGWNFTRIPLLWKWVEWHTIFLLALGLIPGTVLGAHFLEAIDQNVLRTIIGYVLVVLGLYHTLQIYFEVPEITRIPKWGYPIAGVIAGAIAALIGAGNGPIQTWVLHAASVSPRGVIATNGILGAGSSIVRLISYWLEGLLVNMPWMLLGAGVVGAAIGAYMGFRISLRTRDSTIKLLVGLVIIAAGVRLLF